MTEAPERIWIDTELIDSPRKTLACNFGTASKASSLSTDTEYVRADTITALLEELREAREVVEALRGRQSWEALDAADIRAAAFLAKTQPKGTTE